MDLRAERALAAAAPASCHRLEFLESEYEWPEFLVEPPPQLQTFRCDMTIAYSGHSIVKPAFLVIDSEESEAYYWVR